MLWYFKRLAFSEFIIEIRILPGIIEFIYELAEDAKEKTFEWENTTISFGAECVAGDHMIELHFEKDEITGNGLIG